MAKHRVLIYGINYIPEPTGVGRYTGDIAKYLAAEGIDVEVIAAVPHYPGWKVAAPFHNRYSAEATTGIRVVRCPLFLKENIRGFSRFVAPLSFAISSAPIALWQILRWRPKTVLCIEPTLMSAPIALLASRIIGSRTVLHIQDLEVDAAFAAQHIRSGILMRLALTIELAILRRFDTVITISNRMAERLITKGLSAAQVVIVRNWVDLNSIRPLPNVDRYRSELGISPDKFVALYAGNIGVKQGLSILFEAAKRLVDEPSILFLVVGDGPDKAALEKTYGVLSNVRFLPVQPEGRLCELLNLASVHILPQLHDAADLVLPSKLGGMLASGKPCIVMADPGTELHDLLYGSATLVTPGNDKALSEAIIDSYSSRHQHFPSSATLTAAFDARKNLPAIGSLLISSDS